MSVKQLLRIAFGLLASPGLLVVGTLLWISVDDNEGWWESVGKYIWYLISGQWNKLPD